MRRTQLALAMGLVLGSQAAFAEETMEQRLARMESRLMELQKKLDQQEATIREHEATIAEQRVHQEGMPKRLRKLEEKMEEKRATGTGADAWYRNIEIGGLVEVEAAHRSPYQGDSESDIVLATFELGIASRIGEWVEIGGSLLYEQDKTPLEVDVAYATIANFEHSPLFLTAGQIYLPFGEYGSDMISDPLTLEIGETRETALQLGFAYNGFSGSTYLFNGSYISNGKDHIDSWGAHLDYTRESKELSWNLGISYISNLADSDTVQEVVGSTDVSDFPGGWSLHGNVEYGTYNLIAEYLGAADSFDAADIHWRLGGAEPKAWNLEAGYAFDLFAKGATVALAYQGTEQSLALKLPKQRWLLGLAVEILDDTLLSFEWAHDKDYSVNDGGTGENADILTAQLAVEF